MSFKKFTSIEKFSDAWLLMQKHTMEDLSFRSKIKLHGCFSKDTLVLLANGEQEKISEIQPGTSIMSFNEETKKFEVDEVVAAISDDLEKEWIKLTFDNGSTVECTKDHLFLTSNRGWVEAQDLDETDIFVEIGEN